jgi:alpha-L-rhamnosidase
LEKYESVINRRDSGEPWDLKSGSLAQWIFPERSAGSVNQIVDFIHKFTFDGNPADESLLRISADTDYVVWLNGKYIGRGQYSDYPDEKTFDSYSLPDVIRTGDNVLSATVFYDGRNSSVYKRGDAGLLFEIFNPEPVTGSGTASQCRQNPCYHSGEIAAVSHQLSFTFEYDARGDDGFGKDHYIPGDEWSYITKNEASLPEKRMLLSPRPVEKLIITDLTPAQLCASGYYRRVSVDAQDQPESPAWLMQHDSLTARRSEEMFGLLTGTDVSDLPHGLKLCSHEMGANDGVYFVIDMGREEVGHLEFEMEAPEGSVLDIGYGEHLDDLRVRTKVGARNFASRYICREGRQKFTHHFLRWAGRYLQVHVSSTYFTLYGMGLRRCEYPVEYRGKLAMTNPVWNRILNTARRTLQLCMHEHYEDTPWREQALYANDARIQALCGYYAFGTEDFPAASLSLSGRGLRDDGFLSLTAPANPPVTIPSFTLVWILAVRDHFLYTGDSATAQFFLPQIKAMLRGFLEECRDGLLPLRRVEGIWHFYDWSADMSGYDDELFGKGLTWDTPLNCFLILALEAAGEICKWSSDDDSEFFSSAAQKLRNHAAELFWDSTKEVFITHPYTDVLSELTQALAVLAKVGTADQRKKALKRMCAADSGLENAGLSQSVYTFEALMTDKKAYGKKVFSDIESTWGAMLNAGATTFWETILGAKDFADAGSLCHGWSAVPLFFYYHDMLGVRPLEPGYKTFIIDPVAPVEYISSGTVPVPGGEISVQWVQEGTGIKCKWEAPEGCAGIINSD